MPDNNTSHLTPPIPPRFSKKKNAIICFPITERCQVSWGIAYRLAGEPIDSLFSLFILLLCRPPSSMLCNFAGFSVASSDSIPPHKLRVLLYLSAPTNLEAIIVLCSSGWNPPACVMLIRNYEQWNRNKSLVWIMEDACNHSLTNIE